MYMSSGFQYFKNTYIIYYSYYYRDRVRPELLVYEMNTIDITVAVYFRATRLSIIVC